MYNGINHNSHNYLWITWEKQRRNHSMSAELPAVLVEIIDNSSRIKRYIRSAYQTIYALRKYKPDLFFVQNPSIVLATLALAYHKITSVPFVVDAHNSGLFPSTSHRNPLNMLARFIIRHTPITIVTNKTLLEYVESVGGCAAILPDPLPEFTHPSSDPHIDNYFNVLFICTWAEDEPYMEVISAASNLPDDVRIHITGNSKNRLTGLNELPVNVILTGYIGESEYVSILHTCDLVIDLTTRQDCLVCGAYEAISAAQPLILSDTPSLRDYFRNCALYTNNSSEDIAEKILYAKRHIDELRTAVAEEKRSINDRWSSLLQEFRRLLAERFETAN